MKGYKLKRNIALWIVVAVLIVNGDLINALGGNGTIGQKVAAQNKNTAEVECLENGKALVVIVKHMKK